MNVIEKTLADALSHVDVMPSLAGEIRDAFAGARKELEGIRDEAKAFAHDIVAQARSGLDAFKSEVAKIEGEVKDAEGEGSKLGGFVESLGFDASKLTGTPSPDAPVASPAVDVPDAPSKAAEIAASVGAAEEHVAPAVEAHDDAVTNGSTPEVAHAEAQAAAAQAGAEPEDAVRIADGVVAHGVVAEVKPVV